MNGSALLPLTSPLLAALREGGGEMTDRENSPAYAALPRSARRVFAAIDLPSTWWPGER